jgi:acyl-CoA dehydrogenase
MTDNMHEETAAGTATAHTGTLLEKVCRAAEVASRHADDVDVNARFPHEAVNALRRERLFTAGVPQELGGAAAGMVQLATICETLGRSCASTAMIYAMHAIQVACLVRHRAESSFFARYLVELVENQGLIASVTSEVGVGGDVRSSVAGIERRAGRLSIIKDATTISYGATADALLLTARSSLAAPPSDQVLVLLQRKDYALEQTGTWDTMGMRGTCSPGFRVTAGASEEQILSGRFAEIANQTMVPFSHILWSSCWLGIATAAVTRARSFVRRQARSKPGSVPPTALRLAEVSSALQLMRSNVRDVASECEELMKGDTGATALSSIACALKINNLKVSSSELVVQIVHESLMICGIEGYRNDSGFAVGRHLRDACSAALMVGNDRIRAANASMLLVLKDD